ncbi:MAG: helicase HerA-like domain-containing protein, partial [Thermoanaerobaculia bacterium]
RVFTPSDAKNLKATASTFPPSTFFAVDKVLPSLGIGEALVTVLDPRGVPTPVASAQILPPSSSMAAIDEAAYQQAKSNSQIASKYARAIDRESAHEILQRKIAQSVEDVPPAPATRGTGRAPAPQKGVLEEVLNSRMGKNVANQVARTVTQQVMRGIFGMLKGK